MDFSMFSGTIGILAGVAVFGVIIMAILLWIFVFGNKGQFLCDLFEERAGGDVVLLLSNYGIRVLKKKDEIEKWQIINTKIPSFEPKHKSNMIPYLQKGKDKIYLLRDKDGIIHVMNIALDEEQRAIKLLPDYRDPLGFMVTEYDERAKIKEAQSAWKEYQPLVVSFICLALVVITILWSFKYANDARGDIETTIIAGQDKIDAHIAKYSDTILKASQIVLNQEVIDRTANWTTTTIP